jgi:amino acid transporter
VIMLWLTYAAIAALVCFWIAALPGVSLSRVFTTPLLPSGWSGAMGAVPYALWWLVIIETVALASEEAHSPHVSIPRGMVLAQITLVVLVMFTWFFASAAAPYKETGAVDYPLPLVLRNVWGDGWFLTVFSALALTGMVVSYNGMLYATSRQSFSLGRAGYLPTVLGAVHPVTRTPHISLIVWTTATIAFVLFAQWYQNATAAAILISTLAAVVWYVLAMICLYVLRRKEPNLERPYRVPVYPYLPIFVAVLSAMAAFLYTWANVRILLPTAALYLAAMAWYFAFARRRVLPVAPEEVAARIAEELARRKPVQAAAAAEPAAAVGAVVHRATGPILLPSDPLYFQQVRSILERLAAPLLLLGMVSLLWMVLRATGIIPPMFAERNEILLFGGLWVALFFVLSLVGLLSTHGGAAPPLNTSADNARSPTS